MKVEILRKMMAGVAIIGMGFLTGCATVCDIHDPQFANNPMQNALKQAPALLRYGCYYNDGSDANIFSPIFLRRDADNCANIHRFVMRWCPPDINWGVFDLDTFMKHPTLFPSGEPLNTLLRSRMQSSFYKPIEVCLDNKQWWIVYSIIPMIGPKPQGKVFFSVKQPPELSGRLEFFDKDPSLAPNAAALPARIWRVAFNAGCWSWCYTNTLYECNKNIYRVQKIDLASDCHLTGFQISPWSPTIEDVLLGLSSWGGHFEWESSDCPVRMEESLNNLLIEWKTKELPDELGKADAAHLQKAVIRLEKTLLHLDADSSAIKAAIDKAERFVPDPRDKTIEAPPAPVRGEEIAKLIDQRKVLLANILTLLKKALQSKG